jgi:hypothetical protein
MVLSGLSLEWSLEGMVDDNGVQDFLIASGERILIRHAGYRKPVLK